MADVNNLVQWYICTQEEYNAAKQVAGTIKDRILYFISDTKEIYRGTVPYTESTVMYSGELPALGAQGKIYIESTSLAGHIYNGTEWVQVIQPVASSVMDGEVATSNPVSGAAVKAYVESKASGTLAACLTDIKYDGENVALVYTKDGVETSVNLTKLGVQLGYDPTTGVVSLKDKDDTVLSAVNIPLDNFVKDGTYDADAKALVLNLQNGSSVSIPAGDLVQLYNELDSNSVDITIGTDENGKNTIKADVKISNEAGNSIVIKEDGLYVEDATTKMDKLDPEAVDQVVVADATGNAAASGVKIGGATLAETPDDKTLATEAAVEALRQAINQTADDTYVKLSDVIVSYDELNTTDPSEKKVISEAALIETLSWKELE